MSDTETATQLGPVDAYRFARGESVGLPPYDAQGTSSRTLQLERPLDFVALTDHAEFLGLMQTCTTPGSPDPARDADCRRARRGRVSQFWPSRAASGACDGKAPERRRAGGPSSDGNAASVRAGRRAAGQLN